MSKFHVVRFLKENSVTVVPSSWVKGDLCAWPPVKSIKKSGNYVESLGDPDETWQRIPISVVKSADSYEKAIKWKEKAISTSDMNSDKNKVQFSPRGLKRKIKNDNSSSEEEINKLPPSISIKQTSRPKRLSKPGQCKQFVIESVRSVIETPKQSKSSFPPETERRKDESFEKFVLKTLETIQQDVRDLKESINRSRKSAVPSIPSKCPNLPCQNPEELVNLEDVLKDEKLFSDTCDYLSSIGGNSVKDCTRRILQKLLASHLSPQYNWKGTRGVKLGFSSFQQINKLIFASVRKNVLCATATEVEVHEVTKKWLMHAKDRDGRNPPSGSNDE